MHTNLEITHLFLLRSDKLRTNSIKKRNSSHADHFYFVTLYQKRQLSDWIKIVKSSYFSTDTELTILIYFQLLSAFIYYLPLILVNLFFPLISATSLKKLFSRQPWPARAATRLPYLCIYISFIIIIITMQQQPLPLLSSQVPHKPLAQVTAPLLPPPPTRPSH